MHVARLFTIFFIMLLSYMSQLVTDWALILSLKVSNIHVLLKKLMAKKTSLWRKWKALRVPSDYESYRMVAKECHQAVNKFHAIVETNLIRKNNIGSFYNYVNRKVGNKSAVASSIKKSDGSLTSDDNEKAEIFNTFFGGVFTDDNGEEPPIESRVEGATHLENILFTPSAVQRTLQKLKPTSSVGPDQIPNLLLKSLCVTYLICLLNVSNCHKLGSMLL